MVFIHSHKFWSYATRSQTWVSSSRSILAQYYLVFGSYVDDGIEYIVIKFKNDIKLEEVDKTEWRATIETLTGEKIWPTRMASSLADVKAFSWNGFIPSYSKSWSDCLGDGCWKGPGSPSRQQAEHGVITSRDMIPLYLALPEPLLGILCLVLVPQFKKLENL